MLFLFNISVVLSILAGLDVASIWTMPVETADAVLAQLGLVGEAVHFLLVANTAIAGVILLVGVPAYLILRDVGKTVDRFGVFETDLTSILTNRTRRPLARCSPIDRRPRYSATATRIARR